MSNLRREFFALPCEQKQWLTDFLSDRRVWCMTDTNSGGCRQIDPQVLRDEHAIDHAEPDARLYFGFDDLVPNPRLRRTTAGQQEIDFVRSQAVLFSLSVIVRKTILLEGQIAIMHPRYYMDAGIDPSFLQIRFRKVVKAFKVLSTPNTVVVQRTLQGTIKRWNRVIVTQGAAEWKKSGNLLKQFPDGAVDFDIEDKMQL
jgi:hypothetical protein